MSTWCPQPSPSQHLLLQSALAQGHSSISLAVAWAHAAAVTTPHTSAEQAPSISSRYTPTCPSMKLQSPQVNLGHHRRTGRAARCDSIGRGSAPCKLATNWRPIPLLSSDPRNDEIPCWTRDFCRSRRRDLNPRPTHYECVALPLSYPGDKAAGYQALHPTV